MSDDCRDCEVVKASARHAVSVHERDFGPRLTPYGLAHCAAALALVLTDPRHGNHRLACERHGIEPKPLD